MVCSRKTKETSCPGMGQAPVGPGTAARGDLGGLAASTACRVCAALVPAGAGGGTSPPESLVSQATSGLGPRWVKSAFHFSY